MRPNGSDIVGKHSQNQKKNCCGNIRLGHCESLKHCIIITLTGIVAHFPSQNGEIGGI